jgi:hypothetical protein
MAATNVTAQYQTGQTAAAFAVKDFVPEIWTGRLIANLKGSTILPALCTREFEGVLKGAGDIAWVHGTGRVATSDYVMGEAIAYQDASDGKVGIAVEKAKYYAFKVEDIATAQAQPAFVNELTKEAAYALAKDVDRYLYGKMLTASVGTVNDIGLAGGSVATGNGASLTIAIGLGQGHSTPADSAYDSLVTLSTVMDDDLAPDDGRFVILPSFATASILRDTRFVANGQDGGNAMKFGKGSIGKLAGIEVITMPRGYFGAELHGGDAASLSLAAHRNMTTIPGDAAGAMVQVGAYSAGDYSCVAGVRGAMAYIEQFVKTEKLRLEAAFSDAVRGLLLFGGGEIKPQWIYKATCHDTSATH